MRGTPVLEHRAHTTVRRRRRAVVGILALVGATLALTARPSAAFDKAYSATIATSDGPAGTTQLWAGSRSTVVLTLRNESSPQQLGSANVVFPAELAVDGPVSLLPASAGVQLVNGVFELRNLALAPGDAARLTVPVRVPSCVPDASGYGWTTAAKQANDFSGAAGRPRRHVLIRR